MSANSGQGRASTVLVVDDEPQIVRALRINLNARGYDVQLASTGAAGLALAASHPADVVVLDLGLPDMDGVEVVHGLRGWTSVPILVLSARDRESAKVAALDAGADDYVVKPFGMDELLARLRAAVRRAEPAPGEPLVVTAAFTVDLAARRVSAGGQDVRLTPTEWSLLETLARHPGRVLSHAMLLEQVWGRGYEQQAHYLRIYIAALRRKLEPEPAAPRHLITETGRGYRFEP
jgi:two-component system KDP operon response regulator KdpE